MRADSSAPHPASEPASRVFPVACVVLAAGAGTRFGGPKASAVLRPGVRFIDEVISTAAISGLAPVIAVVPAGLDVPLPARAIANANSASEQIHSVRLGLAQLTNSPVVGALLWPVDHPYVSVETTLALLDAARRTGAPIVIPVHHGRRGHPSFFARDTWRELMTVTTGGARTVVRAYESQISEIAVADPGVLRDVNTRADLGPTDDRRREEEP